jgi:hypothetical protein
LTRAIGIMVCTHVSGRSLSVEMASKAYVKSLIVSDELRGTVLFDADIGNLVELSSVDGIVLEVRGTKGTLRVDLTKEELEAMLRKVRSKLPCSESGSRKESTKGEMENGEVRS